MFANNDSVTDFVVLANFFLLNIAFKCSVIVTNMHHQLPITVCTISLIYGLGCAGLWSTGCTSSWEVMPIM